MLHRRAFLLIAAALALACGPARASDRLKAVASFSILADLVRQVGGDRVEVATLVGPDGDVHVFQPSPAEARALAAAQLVFVNGLGFEGWIDRLVGSSGTRATVVVASRGVVPLKGGAHDHGTGAKGAEDKGAGAKGATGHAHGAADPHAWQDVANAKLYIANLRDALAAADPAGRAAYEANAASYLAELDALDAELRASIAAIPPERRRVITNHDAFGYFARAYGLAFIAPQGVSTEAEASARDVARIIRQIRAQNIPAVFLENVSDPRLMQRVAGETGARVGARLYSDALSGPDGPAGTYLRMMRHNIRALSEALAR